MFLIGLILGFVANDFIRLGHQSTYFEANDLENFFLRQPIEVREQVPLTEIVGGDWQNVCIVGAGSNVDLFLTEAFGQTSWTVQSGRIIDEGVLEYLQKLVFTNENGGVMIMNFDERSHSVFGLDGCAETDRVQVLRSEEITKPDRDGYGEFFVEIELKKVE